jgi:nitrogen regulatory protein P-II 2
MKLIVAIIRPEKLQAVQEAFQYRPVCVLSVSQVLGDGREPGYTEIYRGQSINVRRPKVRLEIAVDDIFVDGVVGAIVRAGASGTQGQVGDGCVFVMPLDECVQIRNGDQGPKAIGA